MHFLPRDFIATTEGLTFAVVAEGIEAGRVPCFLRYVVSGRGVRKLNTREANDFLRERHPDLLFHSETRDVQMHGVPWDRVARHFRPRDRVRELLDGQGKRDTFEDRVVRLIQLLQESRLPVSETGVTGSVLVGTHNAHSDIDLVVYDAESFHRARRAICELTRRGVVSALTPAMWRAAYRRRGCSLTFDEYLWHELRKSNKLVFEGTKVDLNLVRPDREPGLVRWRKCGDSRIRARVLDDRQAFDYPSRWQVEHDQVDEVVSFTATFTGQAQVGELIEVAGLLEESADGIRRLVVGTSREATGQYIKVIREAASSRMESLISLPLSLDI